MSKTMILRLNEGDQIVTDSLKRLKQKYGSATVIKWRETSKVGELKKGDQLIVVGHGDTSGIGHVNARQLADAFAKGDMPSGVVIDLVACESGKVERRSPSS
jgi:hypothetical protein